MRGRKKDGSQSISLLTIGTHSMWPSFSNRLSLFLFLRSVCCFAAEIAHLFLFPLFLTRLISFHFLLRRDAAATTLAFSLFLLTRACNHALSLPRKEKEREKEREKKGNRKKKRKTCFMETRTKKKRRKWLLSVVRYRPYSVVPTQTTEKKNIFKDKRNLKFKMFS